MNKIKKLPLFLSTSSLLAYVGYGSWIFGSFKESSEFSTKPAREVCYIKNSKGTTRYTSLDYALKIAAGNGAKDEIFVLPQDGTSACQAVQIKESHAIKSGDSLKLPYESETTKPSDFTGNSVIDNSEKNVDVYRRTLVEMVNGSKLTVDSGGSLIVGGVFNTKGVTGKYAEIALDSNSSIVCNGTMEVYGYIKEKTSSSRFSSKIDGKEMNENDPGRYVEFGSTGSLTCPLAIKDASSGGVMTSLNESGVCPTNEFNIQSIQTYTTFKYGSKAVALARMSAAGQTMEKQCGFVGKDGPTKKAEENCVFYLKSGSSLSMEYVPANPGVTNPAPKADYSKYVLNGQISLGSLYLDVTVTKIDTTKYYFPLSYFMNLYIENGGEFILDHQLKIYPGSSLNIKKGGKLSLNSDLIVYTCADLASFDSSSSFYYPVAGIGVDGKLVDNGLFEISSKGHFGGQVTHTNFGGSSADFSSSDAANLIATSTEGTKKVAVNKQATGIFKTSHGFKESLIAAKQVITSAEENGTFYWNGKYETTVNVSVQLTKQYDNNVYGYTISYADDANGTNAAALSAENSTDIKSYQVSNQKYVRFQTKRAAGIQVDFGDGVRKEIDQSIWYEVGDDDIHVYITPFEGVSVDITTSGNSGSGHVEYTLYESETPNGAFEQVGYNSTGNLKVNVIKGRYFKFTTKSAYRYYFTTKPVYKNGVKVGVHGTENSQSSTDKALGNNIVYHADGNYEFKFSWNFEVCIVEGTAIALANGRTKKVEELMDDDILLAFDHGKGKLVSARLFFNYHQNESNIVTAPILNLRFDDGTQIGIHVDHGFFDLTLGKYVYINKDNYPSFIGHDFVTVDCGKLGRTRLVSGVVSIRTVRVYSPVSVYHLNVITNGLLSITGEIEGWFNYFDYDSSLKYDSAKMDMDIKKYGLYVYDDFKDYIRKGIFDMLPIPYLKVSVGKGLTTKEKIIGVMKKYLSFM